jgi:hypothetical protein
LRTAEGSIEVSLDAKTRQRMKPTLQTERDLRLERSRSTTPLHSLKMARAKRQSTSKAIKYTEDGGQDSGSEFEDAGGAGSEAEVGRTGSGMSDGEGEDDAWSGTYSSH